MATDDTCCTIVPYFKIHDGQEAKFREIAQQMVEATQKEEGALFYGFAFNGNEAFCREGYRNGEALLAHGQNVGPFLQQMAEISDVTKLEIHGPEAELAKIREPMARANPAYFVLEMGFRR